MYARAPSPRHAPPLEVTLAAHEADREAVCRLRYEIYVKEMGRPQPYANHALGHVTDPLDEDGMLLALRRGDAIVGTVRLNLLSGEVGPYRDMYGLEHLVPSTWGEHVIVTALMFDPQVRGTAGLVATFQAAFALAWSHGVHTAWIDCNDHLLPMFTGFGFIPVRRFPHPLYGDVTLLRLDLRDTVHLHRTPFAAVQADPNAYLPRPDRT